MEFEKHSHSTGNNTHHFQWCTKYRYRMFGKERYAEYCRDILHIAAREYGMTVVELAVMPEHVHIEASIPPAMSQSRAMQLLKGRSSYEMFRVAPEFRLRYPKGSLWSKGSYMGSVGRVTAEVVQKYIREQQSSLNRFID